MITKINVYSSCQGLKSSSSAEFSRSGLFERPEEQKCLPQHVNLQASWIAEILGLNFHSFAFSLVAPLKEVEPKGGRCLLDFAKINKIVKDGCFVLIELQTSVDI